MQTKHKIINGDSRCMKELPDKSVHLVITSPPFWQLKDYGTDDQIGFDDSYESYINHLNLVWNECHRLLHNGCRLCVNIGDQFARAVYYGRYKVIPIRTEIIKFCESIGFDYMGAIIWQKKTTTNTTGGASIMGSFPFPRNGILSIDYEFILLFKKLGNPEKPDKAIKEQSKMTKEEWKEYFSGHWYFGGRDRTGILQCFPKNSPSGSSKCSLLSAIRFSIHFLVAALLPWLRKTWVEVPWGTRLISNLSLLSKRNSRSISPTCLEHAIRSSRSTSNIDLNQEINKLPYIFKDFHALDKKIDLKKLLFGSKIDKNSTHQRNIIPSGKLSALNDSCLITA